MYAIEIKQVKKQRGKFLLDIPELKIPKGYITGFIGQNGAGKTTTIKLIMNLILAEEGEIKVLGKDRIKNTIELNQQIGYVGEPTGYPSEANLIELERMIAPFYKNWDHSLFINYIEKFELDSCKKVKELSTGQNKQLALIMALSHHPKLIILDEPTSNLDPVVRMDILDCLMEHMQDEEVSVFYSTHITTDLEKACDYIVYIKDGKMIFNEEKDRIKEEYCIVKGPKFLIQDKELARQLVGVRQTSFGFEALGINKKNIHQIFGNEVKYEKANLDDIMVFLARGRK